MPIQKRRTETEQENHGKININNRRQRDHRRCRRRRLSFFFSFRERAAADVINDDSFSLSVGRLFLIFLIFHFLKNRLQVRVDEYFRRGEPRLDGGGTERDRIVS